MLTLQIASDLHIEYKNNEVPDPLNYITPSADILILAGDIGSLYKFNQLKTFLEKLCPHFQKVIYVPGNHEYYKEQNQAMDLFTLEEILHSLQFIPNLTVLNKRFLTIGEYVIAGCTLWSMPYGIVPKFIVRIHNMNTHVYKNLYLKHLRFISDTMTYCKRNKLKLVMVTHHCPTYKVMKDVKSMYKWSYLYASHLDELLHIDNVYVWICGHIHKNFDFVTPGGTRVVGNQKGKIKDNIEDYSSKFLIDL